jgi:hypothetical protein
VGSFSIDCGANGKNSVVKVGASGGGQRVVAPKGDPEARGKDSYWLEGLLLLCPCFGNGTSYHSAGTSAPRTATVLAYCVAAIFNEMLIMWMVYGGGFHWREKNLLQHKSLGYGQRTCNLFFSQRVHCTNTSKKCTKYRNMGR